MWREKIIETKKAKGITTKIMVERTPSHLTAETITRILNEKTDDPRISTVLALGSSVGLSPWELFAEPSETATYQNFWALQEEIKALKEQKEEYDRANAELQKKIEFLENKIEALKDANALLQLKLEHKEEIIAIHNYYNKLK